MDIKGIVSIADNYEYKIGNPVFYNMIGSMTYSSSILKLIHPDDVDALRSDIESVNAENDAQSVVRLCREDGSYSWVYAKTSIDQTGRDNYIMEFTDVKELVKAAEVFDEDVKKYRTILNSDQNVYFDFDITTDEINLYKISGDRNVEVFKGKLDDWCEGAIDKYNIQGSAEQKLHGACEKLRHGNYINEVVTIKGDNEEPMYIMIKGSPLSEGGKKKNVLGKMLETSDVSLLDKSENKKYDDLTGLLTKNVIRDFAERKVYESGDKLCCFVMLDIDNFKAVNDTYGHVFGDEVIVRVADIITGIVSKNGVVGRFGGDEFFIVLDNVKDNTEVRSILRSIRMTVAETRFEKNPSATFSCSIGSAIYPINGDTYDIIMKKADKALYIAKEKGRNRYVIYDEQIHGELEEDSELIHKSKNDVAGINSSIYDFSKALNNISDTIYNGKKDAIGATLDYISEICEVDRINIYFGKDLKKIYTAGDTSCSEISYANEDYFKLFNNSGALVLNFTYKLEYVHPMAYRAFKAQNVLTAIHCIIGSKDDVKGIITFENLTYAKMFSQNDILLFLTFTNTIKNILTDTP